MGFVLRIRFDRIPNVQRIQERAEVLDEEKDSYLYSSAKTNVRQNFDVSGGDVGSIPCDVLENDVKNIYICMQCLKFTNFKRLIIKSLFNNLTRQREPLVHSFHRHKKLLAQATMANLSLLNYMNVIAYIANVAVTYGIGSLGLFGMNTNTVLSAKYQTLVTPIGLAFAIWGIIFIMQLIFAIVQLLPSFRASPLVAKGIGYTYVYVCISQIAWTLSFSFEIIWLSFLFMLAILYFLLTIVNDEYKVSLEEKTTIRDYWLLKFPFASHSGWILAATMVNLSVVLVAYGVDTTAQYYVAIATLVFLVSVSFFCLGFPTRPEYCIPLVLAWASVSQPIESC